MSSNNNIPLPPCNSATTIGVTSTKSVAHHKLSFAPGTEDPSVTGKKYLPPTRLTAPSSSDSTTGNNSNDSLLFPSSNEDIGTLKHFAYSCPGLTGAGNGNSTHVEAQSFAFLFGLPPDEQQQKVAAFQEMIANVDQKNQFSGAGWNSKRTFQDLLDAKDRQIVIPLYQRGYTWDAETQGVKWFQDLTAKFGQLYASPDGKLIDEGKRSILRHGTGKIVFRKFVEEGEQESTDNNREDSTPSSKTILPWICVDGQQRATTASLLFGAIFSVGVCDVIENNKDFGNNNSTENSEEYHQEKESFLELVNQMIFTDIAAARKWVQEKRSEFLSETNNSNNQQNTPDSEASFWFPEGGRIPGARLIPSHVDRSPFYEAVARQFVRQELNRLNNNNHSAEDDSNSSNSQASTSSTISANFSESCARTLQGKMMLDVFVPRVRKFLFARASSYTSSSASPSLSTKASYLRTLSHLIKHILHGTGVVLVELVAKETRLPQIFLWFQEKSLFGMGALLHNAAPGIDFKAADLVRNLLMAPFSEQKLELQEKSHDALWLKPIEEPSRNVLKRYEFMTTGKKSIMNPDELLIKFNDTMEAEQKREKLRALVASFAKRQQQKGINEDDDVDDDGKGNVTPPSMKDVKLFKSKFQQTVEKMTATATAIQDEKKKNRTGGILLYSRFYSIFEFLLQKLWSKEKQKREDHRSSNYDDDDYFNDDNVDDASSSVARTLQDVERECCEYLLGRMAGVTQAFVNRVNEQIDEES